MIVVASTEPLVPALMKPMLDGTFVHKDQEMMRMVPVVIVLIFLVRGSPRSSELMPSAGGQQAGDGFARRDVSQAVESADALLHDHAPAR